VKNRVARGQHSVVKAQLDAWYQGVHAARWKSSADLKAQFASASILSAERVVFNIKGNDYKLIVSIDYHFQFLRIKWLGTHKEYDDIEAREIKYEKERYSSSSDSQ
jgi:mRNA interferase HigB